MKILVIQQKMIGDVLTSSILFEALRKKFPEAELHYLIQPHTQPVVENNPYIDELVLFDPNLNKTPKQLLLFFNRIRNLGYDLIIDVYAKINTAMMSYFSGAEKRISYRKWYTSNAYTTTIVRQEKPETEAGLAIENRMRLLQGISNDFPLAIKPKIYLTSAEKESARKKLEDAGLSFQKPLIMAGILGSSPSKTYPLEYMAQVLDFVVRESEAQLLFNYIPSQLKEAERLYSLCAAETKEQIHFEVSGNSLREFLAITSHCHALIGNEGGAINMAKALEIPTFAVFSPQIDKETWSIFEDGTRNVSVHLRDYRPEAIKEVSSKELKKNSSEFYKKFTPDTFYDLLRSFLQENLSS